MVTFGPGALHDRPPLTEAERWSGPYSPQQRLWAAAEYLEAAWSAAAPADYPHAEELRKWAEGARWADPIARCMDDLIATVEVVSGAVHGELCRRWQARSAVLELWAARLYQLPADEAEAAAVFDADVLWAEVSAVQDARFGAAKIESDFRSAMISAKRAALNAADEGDAVGTAAISVRVREAGTKALDALRA
ncbi:hypothetical protein FZI85_29950 [Mycobacterium sp. CBMA293]|uniref:hypothetical protein n=1 Tax=unclassified Mycolicibacterium TaxID=2636767 RepID=UPI0012DD37CE|nr:MULTISPECIES: hypothetical protein [unclassified Mycolicibacterium]QGT51757.1 hypothetical protein pCBMA213_3_00015 [Mycolicibacterium sp.]MUL50061.1 hypothetical protein [Mycolicibacterium sp. CBMA 360]MUL62738.1 hypothetical protein [Mycolicibacterium sp. CBMA 335]MUL69617.1 hypothetical protein [Mycolicibacterium sp. CBMA 311]MUL97403.1 hypothetical protein [Mycolicibacterium sp. CBMA 230]